MDKSINAIRFLGMDAINKANSGHPGIVLGAAPMIYSLYTKQMNLTPKSPLWFNRDRFVLAAGHATGMLYPTLHLAGYKVTMEDLKQFRQLNSLTPGHPEYLHTEGIDATSGPLGQGIAMAAGMAIGESYLAATFNKEGLNVVDHYTYALCGDGDLQEGVTQEAISLAGHLGLGKLIVLYDSNDIQLDGPLKWANTENVEDKYKAMNWHYMKVRDANDLDELNEAINVAKGVKDQPSIIEVKSIIGFGSSLAGESATHGAPLGKEETDAMRKRMNYDYAEFEAPESAYEDFKVNTVERGNKALEAWNKLFKEYKKSYKAEAAQLEKIINGELPVDLEGVLAKAELGTNEASRVSGGKAIGTLSEALINLIGGSADLTKSTKAKGVNGDFSSKNPLGRNISFGVREHAMAAIVNGLTLHGLKAFSGGFFVFSDYMKPAMRMAAIMNIPSIYIFTHDSVAVGEDGPTHEPIEQLSMLRTTPNLNVYRPGDANETNYAFRSALESKKNPSVIVLSRQNLEVKKETTYEDFKKGAYVISDAQDFEGILIATGSEVGLAIDTQTKLAKEGINVRVVSMPSMELFKAQSKEYKETILPASCTKRLALEMGAPDMWYQFASNVKGIETFGVSAPGNEAIKFFGFDVDTVANLYKSL
ncbi:Transketolase [Candidatus Izimaplasma bacterium HR1]|jgi:transketolase|uniref:transketolase n=1 Tax=Candidatus Izimoplasma sp. HR1 TaxID=1541959 RepID=UPI0004F6A7D1|nr:Transketolase [Candidatus Izimaplasma bacterium HR1]